jgi:putative FmdB family regulatory protein
MPTYEYQCETCGEVFELRQKFADEPLKVHEKGCGGPVHRLLSAPALQFKGSGWYITDYGRGGSKPDSSNGSKSDKSEKSEKKDSGKSETKTESKASTSTSSSDKKD